MVEELLHEVDSCQISWRTVIGDEEADVPLRPEDALSVEIVRTTRMADATLVILGAD